MLKNLWLIIEFTPDEGDASPVIADALTLALSTLYWVGVAGLLTWVVKIAG